MLFPSVSNFWFYKQTWNPKIVIFIRWQCEIVSGSRVIIGLWGEERSGFLKQMSEILLDVILV